MGLSVTMCPFVSMHVAISGKGLPAKVTTKRPLSRVHQHVTIKRGKGAEHFATQTTVVYFALSSGIIRIVVGLNLIVTSNVGGEVLLRCLVFMAQGTGVHLV